MTEEKLRKVAAAIAGALQSIESESEKGDLGCCTALPEKVLVAGGKAPARVCICLDLGDCKRQGETECC